MCGELIGDEAGDFRYRIPAKAGMTVEGTGITGVIQSICDSPDWLGPVVAPRQSWRYDDLANFHQPLTTPSTHTMSTDTNSDSLRTALYQTHVDLGARMVPFGGWDMPVQYQGTIAEVEAVRTDAGIFDVSHMGRLHIGGPNAAGLLDILLTGSASSLRPAGALLLRVQRTRRCN